MRNNQVSRISKWYIEIVASGLMVPSEKVQFQKLNPIYHDAIRRMGNGN